MPRNGSGGYSLPISNPVVSGTIIASNWANNTLADLGNEVANSLPVDGQKPMAAPLKLIDGAVLSPALTFSSETVSGFYRNATNDLRIGVQGASVVAFTPTGLNSTNIGATTPGTGAFTTLAAIGAVAFASTLSVGSTLNVSGAGTVGGVLTVNGTAIELGSTTTSATALIDFHSSGTTADYDSRIMATGGTSTAGAGTLELVGTTLKLTGATTVTGNLNVTGTITGTSFAGSTAWSSVTGKPTTVSGYGITDAITTAGGNVNSGTVYFTKNMTNSVGGGAALIVQNATPSATGDGNTAMIQFLCQNMYGINMHLRADGYFGIGGWSRPGWSWYTAPDGTMVAAGDVVAYSDRRIKKNIKTVESALSKLLKLNGVTFTRKDNGQDGIGLIAQDVQKVFPEAITVGADEQKTLGVAYGNLVGPIVEALREIKAELDELKRTLH